jgi:chitinase
VVAYYTSWSIYARGYFVTDIPAADITHINYAFANISRDGECAVGDEWADTEYSYPGDSDAQPLRGNFHQLNLLKQAHPHLKTLIAVGGWTWSRRFSDVALTDESRARFAASCVGFITRYGFDGIDLDWEYPTGGGNAGNIERPQDPENFILLLAELRAQLDAQAAPDGRSYLLTIAAGAGDRAIGGLDWTRIAPLLDWINVMTYDYAGGWSSMTGHNAPLVAPDGQPSVDASLRALLARGVPPDQLLMGTAFYGRGFAGTDGLGAAFDSLPSGTWEDGVYDYADLAARLALPGTLYVRAWDGEAQVPTLYHAGERVLVSYDDPESLALKAAYVREHGLGGVMIWELSGDADGEPLLRALNDGLRGG